MSFRLEDLHVFAQVCETGSFQKAARRSELTPSAVTKVVRKLEQHFGVPLIERGSQLTVTPAGQTLYRRAVDSRSLAQSVEHEMAGERGNVGGSIRIGVVPALLHSLALPVVSRFLARDPRTRILISVQLTGELLSRISSGALDLAVGFEVTNVPPDVVAIRVGLQRYCVAGRAGHPLAGRPVGMQELAQAQWLLPSKDVALRQHFERGFADAGFEHMNVRVEVDSSAARFAPLLRDTDLLGLFATQSIASNASSGLAVIDVQMTELKGQIVLLHRRRTPSTGLFAGLRDEFAQQAAQGQ
jgi:DNA-binding transcriptional LysR family regulator